MSAHSFGGVWRPVFLFRCRCRRDKVWVVLSFANTNMASLMKRFCVINDVAAIRLRQIHWEMYVLNVFSVLIECHARFVE